jgi:hypothetical protein
MIQSIESQTASAESSAGEREAIAGTTHLVFFSARMPRWAAAKVMLRNEFFAEVRARGIHLTDLMEAE